MGFPIRKFSDQSLFAAPRNLSQRTTSFIASQRQGIHRIPLWHLIVLIIERPDSTPALRFEKTILLQTHPGSQRSSREHLRIGSTGLQDKKEESQRLTASRPCPSSPAFRPDVFPLHNVRYEGVTPSAKKPIGRLRRHAPQASLSASN